MHWEISWEKINMDYLLEDYMTEDEKIVVLGLSSFHPNGYIREKALKELIKYNDSKIIPFIIIRTCDWVDKIRKEAQEILLNMIQIDNILYIVQNIMLIDKIKENVDGLRKYYKYYNVRLKTIEDDEIFLEKIYAKIESILNCSKNESIVSNALLEGALSKDAYVQEYSLKEIISNDLLPHKEIIEILTKTKDQITCVKSIKLVLDKLNDEEVIELKDYLDKIEGYRAKVELIRRLYTAEYFKYPKDLEMYALSKYASVRDIARFYMRKLGFNKFNKFYMNKLNNSENKKEALLGLCETCKKEDIEIILKFFKNSNSKIQKKILNRIIELSDIEPCCDYNIFIKALETGNKNVIKLSRQYISQNYELFDKEILFKLFIDSESESLKAVYAKILSSGSDWTSLMYSLRIFEEKENIVSKIGYENIERWIKEKRLYLNIDKDTGKISYYKLYNMDEHMTKTLSQLLKKNRFLLQKDIRNIIEGLILNYGKFK